MSEEQLRERVYGLLEGFPGLGIGADPFRMNQAELEALQRFLEQLSGGRHGA